MEAPLVGTSNEVWALQEQRISTVRTRRWRPAARSGRDARGDATNYLRDAQEAHPAMRKSSLREATKFLRANLQVGAPASTGADASLGFPCVGYQSSYIAQNILLRLVDTSPRRPEAARENPAQRAKVGF